jgi:uncharacterized protein YqeY
MSLEQRINEDIKAAMLAKDKESLNALRAVKSAILLLKTEKNAAEINEEAEWKMLQKLAKSRKEAAEIYKNQNRNDLYEEEMFQFNVIAKYLPEPMSEEEIETIVKEIAATHNISTVKEMGKLIGLTTQVLSGKADNKTISDIVKRILS